MSADVNSSFLKCDDLIERSKYKGKCRILLLQNAFCKIHVANLQSKHTRHVSAGGRVSPSAVTGHALTVEVV